MALLEDMFKLNKDNDTANRVAKYAFEVKKVFDADACAHLIQHLEAKIKDPEDTGCTEPINFVMFTLFEALNAEEMLLLIEAIRPEQHELNQSIGGVFNVVIRSIIEQRKRGRQ